ncbi:hypothetical protein PFICI_11020 [Pestalotiopsis fici W106-1]|uniref:FAD-binding domain-containing protein n=1 Tax=Pestalotiopsis fici (strain W106-1 / CGMCC3.15140) TaxID=1229662 RepID=W3WWB2_PESFW|nr:uncharacterized protein PFICI_11020 [Pestalotiopsis fici W106-1]ETS77146.1 hypothetical protein PFICI_11020 [Pestalotiopsis fici W106-1]
MANQQLPHTRLVDNVLRYPKSGINVLVVGAGPSGLLAAIECWRKGDILALGPSAVAVFRHFPSLLQDYYDVGLDCESVVLHIDGKVAVPPMEFEPNRPGVAPHAAFPIRSNTIIGRYDMTNILYKQCVRLDIPIRWNVQIASYEEDAVSKKGRAIATDGTVFEADLVLAADGLGSRSHALTLGKPVRAVSTGYSIYRAAIWTEDLTDTPLIDQYLKEQTRPQARIYAGHNQHIVLVVSKRLVSIAITLPNDIQGQALESWSTTISTEELISSLPAPDYDPLFLEALRAFPKNSVVKWDLCMRDPQPHWTSKEGHVLQLGDSAHSFIPTSANGATVAMEDGASIAECLRLSDKAGPHLAAKVHELLRFERVSLIQLMGLVNRANFHREGHEEAKQLQSRIVQGKWLWGHRSEEYAADNFARAAAHLISGVPFQNRNVPPGYVHEGWTLEDQIAREKQGIVVDLTKNGDWSLV